MKISTAHKKFADFLGNPEALQHPENFLGPNYLAVINFWLYLDTLNQDQWKIVSERYFAAGSAAWSAAGSAAWSAAVNAAGSAAGEAAGSAAGSAARNFAWSAAWYAARNVARYAAGSTARYSAWEIIGSHILLEQGKSLLFTPMFEGL